MRRTDYCSYEVAATLHNAGFDFKCRTSYNTRTHVFMVGSAECQNTTLPEDIISAPSLAQAAQYLREEIGADLVISPRFNSKTGDRIGYFWRWSQRTDVIDTKTYKTFERALSAGISKVLEPFKQYFEHNEA